MTTHDVFVFGYLLPAGLLLLLKLIALVLDEEPAPDMRSKVFWAVADAAMPVLNIILLLSAFLAAFRSLIHDK